jgi:hypothetical protein
MLLFEKAFEVLITLKNHGQIGKKKKRKGDL